MSATERLRELLKERGVEYNDYIDTCTAWLKCERGYKAHADEFEDGLLDVTLLITPEQAVETTLGLEPNDAMMDKLHDKMNTALIEYERAQGIERRDGDGRDVVPFVAKMHQLLEEAATLNRKPCHMDWSLADNGWADHTCSNCGYVENTDVHVTLDWNFCPKCGAPIEMSKT